MPEPPENRIEIKQFPGLIQQSDTMDLPPGAAQEQMNLQSATPGELNCRKGYKSVTFEA